MEALREAMNASMGNSCVEDPEDSSPCPVACTAKGKSSKVQRLSNIGPKGSVGGSRTSTPHELWEEEGRGLRRLPSLDFVAVLRMCAREALRVTAAANRGLSFIASVVGIVEPHMVWQSV